MENWPTLLLVVLLFFGILVLVLVLYDRADRGFMRKWPLQWTGMGYTQLAEETKEAHKQNQTITYNMQPRKTLWDLLQLFLVPLVLALVVVAFNAGQASMADQSQQKQAQLAEQSQQEQVVNTYIGQISNLLLQYNLHGSQSGDPIRAAAQALTLTALNRLDSDHQSIIILFLYRADILKYHYYKHGETDCGDPNVLKTQFLDEQPIITLSEGNIGKVTMRNLNLSCIDLHNMFLEGSNFSASILDRADLGLSDARNADFRYASMNSADLYFLNLENAKLQGTQLEYANMEGICLSHARLHGADLQHADLRPIIHASYLTPYCDKKDNSTFVPANLNGVDLSHADLTGAYLSQADLTGAYLSQAILTGADLTGANLSGARLDKTTNLNGARYNSKKILVMDSHGKYLYQIPPTIWPQGFDIKAMHASQNNTLNGANLSGTSLPGADLCDNFLSGANLSGASLPGANLSDANLSGVNLSGANLKNAFFWGASLSGVNLSGASLPGADLSSANLRGINLSGASLKGAFLWGSSLPGVDLSNTILLGANLSDANLSGVNLSGVSLLGVNLSNTTLPGANLSGASLIGANLSGADLSGANLRNAKITQAQLKGAKSLKNTIMPNGSKHP